MRNSSSPRQVVSVCRRSFALAVLVGCFCLPRCEAADRTVSPAQKPFDPAWSVVRASDGQVRRLIARARCWTPKALDDLKDLDSLESLDLSGTNVDDDGLRAIAPLASLKTLLLADTAISDAGMTCLAGLPRLETLDLSDTRVSDVGVRRLGELPSLETLVTHHSRVTQRGLEALESVRPGFEAVRLWDVAWEEFDHALLTETPRFTLIQDFPYMPRGFRKHGQLQISGPAWKSRSPSVDARQNPKRANSGSPETDFRLIGRIKPGDCGISSVTFGDATLEVRDPAPTYVVDGHGNVRLAPFTLRFDERAKLWLESPTEPASSDSPRQRGAVPESPIESRVQGAQSLASPPAAGPAPSAAMAVCGEWNGRLVCAILDAKTLGSSVLGYSGDRMRPLEYCSRTGIVLVFLHVPSLPFQFRVCYGRSARGGCTCGSLCGRTSNHYCWDSCRPVRPAIKGARIAMWFKSPRETSRAAASGTYWTKDASQQSGHPGSACSIVFAGAGGRNPYLATFAASLPPNPAWPEFAWKQWNETFGFAWRWPDVRIEKHGCELAIPLGRDPTKKRAELVDCLGRKHVIEEQRVDLRGPKKTIVLDVYGRLRVLSAEDAERILRTRLRDYLDNGDPSPAGPVAPVVARGEAESKSAE